MCIFPFYYFQIYVLTVLLVPIRVVGCVLSLLSAWMFACIGLYGTTVEGLNKQPIAGWRKYDLHFAYLQLSFEFFNLLTLILFQTHTIFGSRLHAHAICRWFVSLYNLQR